MQKCAVEKVIFIFDFKSVVPCRSAFEMTTTSQAVVARKEKLPLAQPFNSISIVVLALKTDPDNDESWFEAIEGDFSDYHFSGILQRLIVQIKREQKC